MSKLLLIVTALVEVGTGVALLIAPSFVVELLLGEGLSSPQSLVLGRITGAARSRSASPAGFSSNGEPSGTPRADRQLADLQSRGSRTPDSCRDRRWNARNRNLADLRFALGFGNLVSPLPAGPPRLLKFVRVEILALSVNVTSLIVFACVFGAAFLGMLLRVVLPEHHLSSETKDSVKLAMGLVATMAALILGLLVASAKDSYDKESSGVTQMAAKIVFLDRMLANFGPETKDTRCCSATPSSAWSIACGRKKRPNTPNWTRTRPAERRCTPRSKSYRRKTICRPRSNLRPCPPAWSSAKCAGSSSSKRTRRFPRPCCTS